MNSKLVVYGHEFCADARRMKDLLEGRGINFEWRDIVDGDPAYREELMPLARGYLSVPTLVFPDGEVMVEPNPRRVLEKLARSVT
jgi:mycoredoxin